MKRRQPGPRVRVYIATSLDGFIAGPDDDLSWLDGADPDAAGPPPTDPASGALSHAEFMADVGAMLMGRRTYDVVRGFDVPWPETERPVLVATHRPLDEDPPPNVRAVQGSIDEVVEEALDAAGGKDVYIDGGELIRQAADADLIDELTITIAPVAIGEGLPLFGGMASRYPLLIVSHHSYMGMVQIRAVPRSRVG